MSNVLERLSLIMGSFVAGLAVVTLIAYGTDSGLGASDNCKVAVQASHDYLGPVTDLAMESSMAAAYPAIEELEQLEETWKSEHDTDNLTELLERCAAVS